jgi:hypothetical protein
MNENDMNENDSTETIPEGLRARKVYLTPEMDNWLITTFGANRQRSAAMMAALEMFREAVEAKRGQIRTRSIFSLEDVLDVI